MTKKHYIALAEVFRKYLNHNPDSFPIVEHLASEVSRVCAEDNPNFNRERFLRACGMDQPQQFTH